MKQINLWLLTFVALTEFMPNLVFGRFLHRAHASFLFERWLIRLAIKKWAINNFSADTLHAVNDNAKWHIRSTSYVSLKITCWVPLRLLYLSAPAVSHKTNSVTNNRMRTPVVHAHQKRPPPKTRTAVLISVAHFYIFIGWVCVNAQCCVWAI